MVVKFADTQRDKELKRLQTQRLTSINTSPGLLGMQAAAVSHHWILLAANYSLGSLAVGCQAKR